MHLVRHLCAASLCALVCACGSPWNNPYPSAERTSNVQYSSFAERPKHLDPVQSYSSNEIAFTAQIYTPPLQYHYLKRPYVLVPFAATEVPVPVFLDAENRVVEPGVARAETGVTYSLYTIRIRPGMRYQPHPAFVRTAGGDPKYVGLTDPDLVGVDSLADFSQTDAREVTADDFVYQIKRLAHPRLHSPIVGLMSEYIVGLKAYAERLRKVDDDARKLGAPAPWLDLRSHPLDGVEVVDRYTYRVKLHGKYPQFVYWLAMPFFAPVPVEVDRFYAQPPLVSRNITLDWYPVGAGPYMLTVNDPNRQMVLERNPNYFGETYPDSGEDSDIASGLLVDAGKPLPFIDRAVFSVEKESIPYWNKFLQGYYDASGITSDAFDQAVQVGSSGEVTLTDEMRTKGIELKTAVQASTFYMGFNMLDNVIGGLSERARKLRQAISIAVDYEEYVSIFANGRGLPAQGPVPPGIFGYREGEAGINKLVYDWVDGAPRRKPVETARALLAEAGYPGGADQSTGSPLALYLDATARGPDDKARLDWLRKQFSKLNINLVVRATDYNRFQEKIRKGNAQIFTWGWNADYPDPENFLFLLHGAQGKVKAQGENAANYVNPEFDKRFERMKNMQNGPERAAIIDEMVEIVRADAPWLWGMHPVEYGLAHGWARNRKPNQIANNVLKYQRVDAQQRAAMRERWNAPVLWPIAAALAMVLLFVLPAAMAFRRRERRTGRVALSAR